MEYEIKEQLSNSKYFTAFQRKLVTINGPLGMVLKVKRLTETATLPTFGSEKSAGIDLYADIQESITLNPGDSVILGSGIACEFPSGYWGMVVPRSSIGIKRGLSLSNDIGVIDEDYIGEIKLSFYNHGKCAATIEPNERVAQMILLPYYQYSIIEVDELNMTERGENGIGSSGKF